MPATKIRLALAAALLTAPLALPAHADSLDDSEIHSSITRVDGSDELQLVASGPRSVAPGGYSMWLGLPGYGIGKSRVYTANLDCDSLEVSFFAQRSADGTLSDQRTPRTDLIRKKCFTEDQKILLTWLPKQDEHLFPQITVRATGISPDFPHLGLHSSAEANEVNTEGWTSIPNSGYVPIPKSVSTPLFLLDGSRVLATEDNPGVVRDSAKVSIKVMNTGGADVDHAKVAWSNPEKAPEGFSCTFPDGTTGLDSGDAAMNMALADSYTCTGTVRLDEGEAWSNTFRIVHSTDDHSYPGFESSTTYHLHNPSSAPSTPEVPPVEGQPAGEQGDADSPSTPAADAPTGTDVRPLSDTGSC